MSFRILYTLAFSNLPSEPPVRALRYHFDILRFQQMCKELV